jgi:hypothetical protein
MMAVRLWVLEVQLRAVRELILEKRIKLAALYLRYALSPWEK